MVPFIGVLIVLSGILGSCIASKPDRCVHDGDDILFRVKTWSDLRHWRNTFPECDDGYLAEGVSEFVTKSLADRWSELASLQSEIERDPQFKPFVVRHVDATAGPERLEAIVENATSRCPSAEAVLCSGLAHAARVALREYTKLRGVK